MTEDWNEIREFRRVDWQDIEFTVLCESYDHRLEVRVYQQVVFRKDGGVIDQIGFHEKDWTNGFDLAPSIEEAQVYLSGEVKWDGCSNWRFDEQENANLHFCEKDSVNVISEIMRRCYDLAAEMIPNWNG